jgi:hypothetical protein
MHSPIIFTFCFLQTLLKLIPLWTFVNGLPKYNKLGQRRIRRFLENMLRWFRLEILCECGNVFVGQREGYWYEVQGTPEICTSERKDSPSRYLDCFIKEIVEIHLKKSNFNRDFGILLGLAWFPLTSMLLNKIGRTKQSKYLLQPPPLCLATSCEPRFLAGISWCRWTSELLSCWWGQRSFSGPWFGHHLTTWHNC